jgi:uncharacterized membrane protein YhaH (DUF805 family)
MDWYIGAWKKYAQFSGRARRTEFWYFQLFQMIVAIVLVIPMMVLIVLSTQNSRLLDVAMLSALPFCLFAFAGILPSLAIMVRRLHDTGRSGWWYFISFVPLVGGIVLLIFTLLESEPGPNLYGPNPKGVQALGPMPPYAMPPQMS